MKNSCSLQHIGKTQEIKKKQKNILMKDLLHNSDNALHPEFFQIRPFIKEMPLYQATKFKYD